MNKGQIFIAYKPLFESSNAFLGRFKRAFNVRKAGFSGTLDPFAKGVLLIATGSYTRLFSHLQMAHKTYRATLWLGAKSPSLDIENIESIVCIPPHRKEDIEDIFTDLQGDVTYVPPSFSAKKIHGKRAYELARSGKDVELAPVSMRIFSLKLICYSHPFITFEVAVSKGGYVRSLGQMIAERLGVCGVLSSLERLFEGDFSFSNSQYFKGMSVERKNGQNLFFQELDILKMLSYPIIQAPMCREKFLQGKKMKKKELNIQSSGRFTVEFEDFFSIIQAEETDIVYLLNRIEKC